MGRRKFVLFFGLYMYSYLLGSLHSSHSQLNVNYLSMGGNSTYFKKISTRHRKNRPPALSQLEANHYQRAIFGDWIKYLPI